MKRTHIFAAATVALALTACQSSTQTSSGTYYLARYDASYETTKGGGSDVDAVVRRIAAIEPDIRFPARIGLARISHGGLGDVPTDEGFIWQRWRMTLAQNMVNSCQSVR